MASERGCVEGDSTHRILYAPDAAGLTHIATEPANLSPTFMVIDDIDRALGEERPGPLKLESALLGDTLADVAAGPPLVLDSDATLADALRVMREHRRGYVLLVQHRRLVGIFTERDVLMKVAGTSLDLRNPVSAHMTRDPETLPPDASVAFALNKMIVEGFRHVPLVDDEGYPTGVVSMREIIDYLSDFYRQDVLNLPPDPGPSFRKRDSA